MSELRVGVVGLGMMGQTHLDVYAKRPDVKIVAVSDLDADRLHGRRRAGGNIEGQAKGGADLSGAAKHAEGMDLIHDPNVDVVDICLPTPLHLSYAQAALAAGKHVLVEKPLARTAADAYVLADAAEASDRVAMPAMCMRFWPGWDWLKAAVDDRRFGRLRSVGFRRMSSHPGGPFYSSGEAAGGAILDLHIHDVDFVQHLLGVPASVFSRGYAKPTSELDHVVTQYLYDGDDTLVTAEGAWAMAPGFGFHMSYTANFEEATAVFDLQGAPTLKVIRGGEAEPVELAPGMGYDHEIDYFIGCVRDGRKPERVTMRQAAHSVAIVEAERRSAETKAPVAVETR